MTYKQRRYTRKLTCLQATLKVDNSLAEANKPYVSFEKILTWSTGIYLISLSLSFYTHYLQVSKISKVIWTIYKIFVVPGITIQNGFSIFLKILSHLPYYKIISKKISCTRDEKKEWAADTGFPFKT